MAVNLSSILIESLYNGNYSILENYTSDGFVTSRWPGTFLPATEISPVSGPNVAIPTSSFSWENASQLQRHPSSSSYLSTLATLATDIIVETNLIANVTLSLEQCGQLNVTVGPDGTSSSHPGIVCLPHAPALSKSAIIRVIVLSAMAFVSLLGNIATMCSIQRDRKTRRLARHNWSAIYSLIFHLSIADLLVTGFCMIGEAAWSYTVEWMAGMVACKLFKLLQMFSLYLSTYVLVLVGVDRWVAVKYPMKSLNTARRCHRYLLGAYSLSFLLSIPQWMIFRVAKGPFLEDFYQCVTHGFYTDRWQEQLYTTFTLVFMFIIPLLILIGTYLSTFRTISSSEKIFRIETTVMDRSYYRRSDTNRQRLIHKAKMKSLRISVVIVVVFIVCWTPYYIMMLIFMFLNPTERLGEDLQTGIFFFGMSNSLINPLIYGAFHLIPIRRRHNQYNQHVREGSAYFQRSSTCNNQNGNQNLQLQHQQHQQKQQRLARSTNLTVNNKLSNSHSNLAEEISLMSLEKDLKSLDENVNQIHLKSNATGKRSLAQKFYSLTLLIQRTRPTKL
ncbi:gonadotropin-releasing hormone receptor [Wyeomyia smithii]|uniref:gonadotropin-releasing hormone receptor n=1 Tax=Wyeomyia smithii TaxID=174621 RepID=UPI002467E490|nr:gonadotropin-releasing hormone receptor [Wyeomyia smithii]XP_055546547.1 gonadotropin-releasing hormone receptor [Wyeomyia smithii]XP_055546548.1 gonadotropin-releasing hormone receptor [Wyeomyia smithii]XP_055546549.1 gonadotropin-releasing hormone receptor [Wyeomyia smithii]